MYLWHWMPLQTNKQLSSSWEQYWSQLTWCLSFVSTQLPGRLGKQLVAWGTAQLSSCFSAQKLHWALHWPEYWTRARPKTYSILTPFSSNEGWKLNSSLKIIHNYLANFTSWFTFQIIYTNHTHRPHTRGCLWELFRSTPLWQTRALLLYVNMNTWRMERKKKNQ